MVMKHRSQTVHRCELEQNWIYTDKVEKELWKSQEACALLGALSDSQFLYLKIEIMAITAYIKYANV